MIIPMPPMKSGDERLLVYAVAVPEGVPVEQDVPVSGVPINGKEEVDAETMKRAGRNEGLHHLRGRGCPIPAGSSSAFAG